MNTFEPPSGIGLAAVRWITEKFRESLVPPDAIGCQIPITNGIIGGLRNGSKTFFAFEKGMILALDFGEHLVERVHKGADFVITVLVRPYTVILLRCDAIRHGCEL